MVLENAMRTEDKYVLERSIGYWWTDLENNFSVAILELSYKHVIYGILELKDFLCFGLKDLKSSTFGPMKIQHFK